jgi:hypothetical protein
LDRIAAVATSGGILQGAGSYLKNGFGNERQSCRKANGFGKGTSGAPQSKWSWEWTSVVPQSKWFWEWTVSRVAKQMVLAVP